MPFVGVNLRPSGSSLAALLKGGAPFCRALSVPRWAPDLLQSVLQLLPDLGPLMRAGELSVSVQLLLLPGQTPLFRALCLLLGTTPPFRCGLLLVLRLLLLVVLRVEFCPRPRPCLLFLLP